MHCVFGQESVVSHDFMRYRSRKVESSYFLSSALSVPITQSFSTAPKQSKIGVLEFCGRATAPSPSAPLIYCVLWVYTNASVCFLHQQQSSLQQSRWCLRSRRSKRCGCCLAPAEAPSAWAMPKGDFWPRHNQHLHENTHSIYIFQRYIYKSLHLTTNLSRSEFRNFPPEPPC